MTEYRKRLLAIAASVVVEVIGWVILFTELHPLGLGLIIGGPAILMLAPERESLQARPVNRGVRVVQVALPTRFLRLLQARPLVLILTAFSGASISVVPALLFMLGQENASFTDWRVIACFAVTFAVPLAHMKLGGLVIQAVQYQDKPSSLSAAKDRPAAS